MIKQLSIIVCCALLLISLQATEHCNALLEHGITNITKQKSAKHTIAYKWHNNCGTDFTSANDTKVKEAGVGIFGYGSVNSNSDISSLKKRVQTWCNQNKNFAESRNDLYEEARTISEPALSAWNQCIANTKNGVTIDTSIQGENDNFIDFTIDSISDGTHIFYGVSQVGYPCKIETEDKQIIVSNAIISSG